MSFVYTSLLVNTLWLKLRTSPDPLSTLNKALDKLEYDTFATTRDEYGFTNHKSSLPSPLKSPNPYQPSPCQLLPLAHSISGAKLLPVDRRTITRDDDGFTNHKSCIPSPLKSPKPYQPAPFQLLPLAHSTSGAKLLPVDRRTITREDVGFTNHKSCIPSPLKSPKPYHPAPFQLLLLAHSTSGAKLLPVDRRTITRDDEGFTNHKSCIPSPLKSPKPYQPAPCQLLPLAHSTSSAKLLPVDRRTITRDDVGFTNHKSCIPSPLKSPKPYQPAPAQLLPLAHSTSGAKLLPVDRRTITRDDVGFTNHKSCIPSPLKSPKPYHPPPAQLLPLAHSTSGAKLLPVDRRTITREDVGFTNHKSCIPSPLKSPKPYQPAPFQLLPLAHSDSGFRPFSAFTTENNLGELHAPALRHSFTCDKRLVKRRSALE
ncbi:Statherin [compost metagenome]